MAIEDNPPGPNNLSSLCLNAILSFRVARFFLVFARGRHFGNVPIKGPDLTLSRAFPLLTAPSNRAPSPLDDLKQFFKKSETETSRFFNG